MIYDLTVGENNIFYTSNIIKSVAKSNYMAYYTISYWRCSKPLDTRCIFSFFLIFLTLMIFVGRQEQDFMIYFHINSFLEPSFLHIFYFNFY
jgi:hypothetical protein